MSTAVAALGANYFAVQNRALKIIGFNLLDGQLVIEHPIWATLLLVCLISHNATMLADGLLNLSDLVRFTDTFAVINQGTVTMVKLLVFMIKRRRIGAILQRMHTLNAGAAGETLQQREELLKENLLNARFSRLFRNLAYGNIMTWAVMPIATALLEYLRDGRFQPRTPMDFSFWLDAKQPKYYWPVYLWSMLAISATCCVYIAVDTIFFWLVQNVSAQFRVLHLQLSTGSSCRDHVVQCVQRHVVLLEMAQEMSDIYAEIMFVQYTLSYLLVCSLSYHFSRGVASPQMILHAGFLIAVLAQLTAICSAGEYLKQQSSHVAQYVYDSFDWAKMPVASSRLLLLMMMRAQKPSKISGYMFNVDRPLLLWVLRTTGSFLALLRTLEHQPK